MYGSGLCQLKKDFENSLFRTNEKYGKNGQDHFFRTLKINHGLTAIQGVQIQENWLNLGKNSKLNDILACPIVIPLSQAPQ